MSLFGSFWKKECGNTQRSSSSGKWRVGDKIANRFEIYQILGGKGKSGMGIVYVCYDHELKIPMALKTFQEQYLFSEETQKLFEREALLWTHLERYPYIVRVEWVERLEGRLFIILEYVAPDQQGRNTLTHYLGDLTLSEILKFSIQFCYGMEYAYSKGIDCHRDIKPDNIMITADKIVKITDFGLAKAFQELQLKEDIIASGENQGLSIFQTKGGKRACGTLQYMAPEQFDGYADRRSDIYAFGIVLYQMASNKELPPFIARTQEEYERWHKYGKVPIISSPLFPLIKKCLEKNPNERFQDFVSIKEEFQHLLLKETGERITPPKIEELEAWAWYNKGVALGFLGRYQEAITCYDEAIRIDSRVTEAWSNKGVVLGGFLGRYQEAITCYDEAISINPRYAEVRFNKALSEERIGNLKGAVISWRKYLEIANDIPSQKELILEAEKHLRDLELRK